MFIENHNNLHLKPIEFKQNYFEIPKGLFGLLTASIQLGDDQFVCAIVFHQSLAFNLPWKSFNFTEEGEYKDFCENIIGLLPEDHEYWQEIMEEAERFEKAMMQFKKRVK